MIRGRLVAVPITLRLSFLGTIPYIVNRAIGPGSLSSPISASIFPS